MIQFTTKELITLAIAIVSIVFNIIQWQKQRIFYKPIYNALAGLFNDIKTKEIHCYGWQKALESNANPEKDADSLRHQFLWFIRETIIHFAGIKEHIVAALKTMDKSDKEIFKAADFGLTPEEKRQREEFFKRGRELSKAQS